MSSYRAITAENGSLLRRLVDFRICGKSPVGVYLRMNQRAWKILPESIITLSPIRSYGGLLHKLVQAQSNRGQACHTFFLRNRPALGLIGLLVERRPSGDTLRGAVLGCSQHLGWQPMQDLLEEMHAGTRAREFDWPWNYSALEPLNKGRQDWRRRYAAAFQVLPTGANDLRILKSTSALGLLKCGFREHHGRFDAQDGALARI